MSDNDNEVFLEDVVIQDALSTLSDDFDSIISKLAGDEPHVDNE